LRRRGKIPTPCDLARRGFIKGNGLAAKKKKKMVRRTGRKSKKARLARRQTIIRSAVILVAILIIAAGVWWFKRPREPIIPIPRADKEFHVTLFYPESTDMFLVPVQRKINLAKKEDKFLRSLKELRKGPSEDPINLLPSLPAGCNVLSVEVHGPTAKVNFNNLTLDLLDETTEKWFYKSVLHTLCAFEEIERVDFFFEGQRIPNLPQGTDVSGPRAPKNLNLSYAPLESGEREMTTLYFLDKSGTYLIPITEQITSPDSKDALVILSIRRLLGGPSDADSHYLSPLFNKGVSIREHEGVVEVGNHLTVAFTAKDPFAAISADPVLVYNALRLTLESQLEFDEFDVLINNRNVEEFLGLDADIDSMHPVERFNLLEEREIAPPVDITEENTGGDE
jgi:spore germination protein GerM